MSNEKKNDSPAPAPQAGVGSGTAAPQAPGTPTPAGAPAAGATPVIKPAAPGAAPAPGAPAAPAIQLPKAPDGQMCLRVNGKDHFIDPKKYRTLIGALHDLGYDIPHFCYHPGLTPDGNCRMCYVNQVDVMSGKPIMAPNLAKQPFEMYPKPIISCREPLNPRGMVIETETPSVVESRKWVMEFLLINHPLDCPVCDKAGECMLQNNSFEHGKADSRFEETKNEKPPKDLAAPEQKHGIRLWTDRCITCTRCTRFLDEVSGTSELYVINRGDRSEIDIAPGHPVDNPLSGNIVDICPVGALIDRDIMFSYRAFYLQRHKSICPDCSKGCNIEVQVQKQYVRRLQPRENREVNGWWMCDYGRHDINYINDKKRFTVCRVNGADVLDIQSVTAGVGQKLAERAKASPESVAGLVSAWLTVEELHTFKRLFADTLGSVQVGLLARPITKEEKFPGFVIEADKNPNRAGAQLVFGADVEKNTARIIDGIKSGKIKALYVAASIPHYEIPSELLEVLPKVEYLVVQDLAPNALTEKAHVVLPGSSYAEKDGVFINSQKRAQALRRAIDPIGQGHDDLAILQRVLRGAGAADVKLSSAREVFRKLAESYGELAGLSHRELGDKGRVISSKGAGAAAGE
ncbi:MAG TPA: molybdopterin-dependent oxidoreductase [Planctomycetota bacterium]|nr:molybdopterin-dependent oxidoreductase [Planctomycetota bacterium]